MLLVKDNLTENRGNCHWQIDDHWLFEHVIHGRDSNVVDEILKNIKEIVKEMGEKQMFVKS